MTDFKPENTPEEQTAIEREMLIAIYTILKAGLIGLVCIAVIILSILLKDTVTEKIAEARCKQDNTLDFCKHIEEEKIKQQPSKEDSHE